MDFRRHGYAILIHNKHKKGFKRFIHCTINISIAVNYLLLTKTLLNTVNDPLS